MKKGRLHRHLPSRESILAHRSLRRVRPWLDHGYLWHFSRHSVPGALAAGLACALLPPPLQTISAVLLALRCRLHLPTALLGTLLTNPLTIVPIYWLAYEMGALMLGQRHLSIERVQHAVSTDISSLWPLLGWPWLLGLVLMAAVLAALAYGLSRAVWSVAIRWRWHQRCQARTAVLIQSRKR